MSKIFVTSDTHFGHENIIRLCKRPFDNRQHMDSSLERRWNARVSPEDTIYHLGDVSWYSASRTCGILERLNGTLIVVWGNHDNKLRKRWEDAGLSPCPFTVVEPVHTIRVGNRPFVLCHYPIEEWDGFYRDTVHLHGHCHGNLKHKIEKRFDVGVDIYGGPVEITADLRYLENPNGWFEPKVQE